MSTYSTLVWLHLGVSIATGAFFIYNLFHRSGTESDAINNCESKDGDDEDTCKKAFELARGIIVALLVVFWLLELCKSQVYPFFVCHTNTNQRNVSLPVI